MPEFCFDKIKRSNSYTGKKPVPSDYGYSSKDLERICVYAHYYDNEDKPFYIGQGKLSRAFVFNKSLRNKQWVYKVKDLSKVKVEILYIDISEEDSINLEKQLISKYGRIDNNTGYLVNENDGGKNSQFGKDNYFYNQHFNGKDNPNYGNKYELNPLSIPVIQIDIFGNIIKEWSSSTEAAEIGGFSMQCIIQCCKGKRHIHNNYQWIYKSDYDCNKDYSYKPGKTNNRIYIAISIEDKDIILIYNNIKEAVVDGFNSKNISAVVNGSKKSHKGFIFYDFFRLPKEEQIKYVDKINLND